MKHEMLFELKDVAVGEEDGTFTGLLSAYGNKDLGGDIVEVGAFTKSLADSGGTIPMLWQHKRDEPIGLLELTDTPKGLQVKGAFDLNVERARETYSLAKKKIVKGLSIGYDTIRDEVKGGVRHLKELKLWEGSVVTFPMNQLAVITNVKDEITSESIIAPEVNADKEQEAKAGRRHSAATKQRYRDLLSMHEESKARHESAITILKELIEDGEEEPKTLNFDVLSQVQSEIVAHIAQ